MMHEARLFFIGVGCVAAAAVLGFGCDSPTGEGGGVGGEAVVVGEAYLTEYDRDHNVDSPAVWRHDDGAWLFATAKATDLVLVFDAEDGTPVTQIGGRGSDAGEFRRPNGITVVGDVLFVVERDNDRVQAFSLPELEPLGTFGQDTLEQPYGIAAVPRGSGAIDLYVTDQDEREDVAEDEILESRVKQFHVTVTSDGVEATLVRAFGESSGDGVLLVVESILADAENDRLLIADEEADDLKVYTLDGRFTGEVIRAEFDGDAEGIALYECGNDGYWIATEQRRDENLFHVFDRNDFSYMGAFQGQVTRYTDGVALTRGTLGPLVDGAFFAVHDDASVAAFSWADIAEALELDDC